MMSGIERLAIHEAGHALVAIGCRLDIHEIVLKQQKGLHAEIIFKRKLRAPFVTEYKRIEGLKVCLVSLGGWIATGDFGQGIPFERSEGAELDTEKFEDWLPEIFTGSDDDREIKDRCIREVNSFIEVNQKQLLEIKDLLLSTWGTNVRGELIARRLTAEWTFDLKRFLREWDGCL